MDEWAKKPRRIDSSKEIYFRCRRNEAIFRSNITLVGSEFRTVGAATEKLGFQLLLSADECEDGYY